ncbi:MAG TPA: hypothetical protein PLR41_11045 [Alphaproteobacteria bacterium]|nr:hypothetical protein [Alphaproteobacteria bacterium]
MLQEDPDWHDKPALEQLALRPLLAAWQGWRNDAGEVPLRARFDPAEFPRLLPWLVLFEILPAGEAAGSPPMDLGIRYIGSEVEHYFDSRNTTGKRMSAFGPLFLRRWSAIGAKVAETRAPRFFDGAPFQVRKSFVNMEMLALPLSRDGAGVDFLLLGLALRGKGNPL